MRATTWKRLHDGRTHGQAAVELALSVPLLLMMFLVVVETGRAFYIAISVSNAARAGVQYGSQNRPRPITPGCRRRRPTTHPILSG